MRGRRTLVIQRINKELSKGVEKSETEEKEKRARQEEKRQFLLNKKQLQLEKEEMLESEWERQQQEFQGEGVSGEGGRRGKWEKQRYKIRLQNSFLAGVTVCGDHIIGCYAPNGWHAEKPIENALKCNVTFISVYKEEPTSKESTTKKEKSEGKGKEKENGREESEKKERKWGPEIENAEVVFTDQGVSIPIST